MLDPGPWSQEEAEGTGPSWEGAALPLDGGMHFSFKCSQDQWVTGMSKGDPPAYGQRVLAPLRWPRFSAVLCPKGREKQEGQDA